MKNIFNILKTNLLIVFCFCLMAVNTAEAKTITNQFEYIDQSRLYMFYNMFTKSGYSTYLLASERVISSYSSYNNYYFCLSNDNLEYIDINNSSLNCNELYSYYREDNKYVFKKISDDVLKINNSIYYSDNFSSTNLFSNSLILGILVITILMFFLLFLFKLF